MSDRRPSFQAILFFAVFVGLVAVLGALKALQATIVPTRRIVVAVRDIPEGTVIDRRSVTTSEWPAATVPVGAFATIDSVVGRIARVAVFNRDVLVPGRLAPVGSRPGLEARIFPGKRAMGVLVDDVAGITASIQPNSRVDVLVTTRPGAPSQRQAAKVFMENMRVLSIDWHDERDGAGAPIDATLATLEVTPGEAERLAVAMTQGSIQLVLRGYGDPANVTTSGASSTDVLAQLRARAARLPGAEVKSGPRRTPPRAAPETSAAPDSAAAEEALAVGPSPVFTPARPESAVARAAANDLVIKKFERIDSAGAVRKP